LLKLTRRTSPPRNSGSPWRNLTSRSPLTGLVLAAICFAMALGLTVRVSALPVEARTQETWYSYHSELSYDFSAAVTAGSIYPSSTVKAHDLYQLRVPIEPPVYKRMILTKLADSVTLHLPFRFEADRPGEINVVYWVEGTLMAPGFWQKPYPLVQRKELKVSGAVAAEVLDVQIPLRQLALDMDRLAKELDMRFDPVELRIRPVVQVSVTGLQQDVKTSLNPELLLAIRGASIEVDEPRVFEDNNVLSTTKLVPITMNLFGWQLPVATARRIALTTLTVFTVLLGGMTVLQWLKRRMQAVEDLKRLGASLISARSFEMPEGATVVDVSTVHELISLHLHVDRPVIKVGTACYLVDGSICYRLLLGAPKEPEAS
jgi:hypothetical protein